MTGEPANGNAPIPRPTPEELDDWGEADFAAPDRRMIFTGDLKEPPTNVNRQLELYRAALEAEPMTDRHLRVHHLWILAKPNGEVIYAMGENPRAAWENGIYLMHDWDNQADFLQYKAAMRSQGYRARRIQFEVDVKELPR